MATVADSNHRDYKHTELQKKTDLRKVKKHNHGVKPPVRDLSEINRGRGWGGNFKFGFGNEVTHRCNGSEIC